MRDVTEQVNKLRKELDLNTTPIDVMKICEAYGITVSFRDFSVLNKELEQHISGMILAGKSIEDGKSFIFVDESDISARQNFTLAHELGHYFLHVADDADGVIVSFRGLKNTREREADKFATELLMPRDLVLQEYKKLPFPTLSYMAAAFHVSRQAMKFRLEEMGLAYIG